MRHRPARRRLWITSNSAEDLVVVVPGSEQVLGYEIEVPLPSNGTAELLFPDDVQCLGTDVVVLEQERQVIARRVRAPCGGESWDVGSADA